MTVSLYLSNIADAISNISVSGVTVKDRDQIVGNWMSTPNVLYPNAEEWITDFNIEYAALLQGASAPMDISYALHYRFLGTAVGDFSTFPKAYSDMVDKVIAIVNAMIAVSAPYSGKIEMKVGNIGIGPAEDPAGNSYFGADIMLLIKEMQN